jgi:hypothetical protein
MNKIFLSLIFFNNHKVLMIVLLNNINAKFAFSFFTPLFKNEIILFIVITRILTDYIRRYKKFKAVYEVETKSSKLL